MAAAVITLTTDFGLTDPYVAAMKGVIRSRCSTVAIDDLTHAIPPQDVMAANRFLAAALPYYPEGSIHVAVVDPGVGTARHPVAIQAGGRFLIGPDNGIFTTVLQGWPMESVRRIENPAVLCAPISKTFHGRDVFAPAGAALAAGFPFEDLGAPGNPLQRLNLPKPLRLEGGILRGEVVHIDHFGNCISNITRADLANGTSYTVTIAGRRLAGIQRTYGEVEPGSPVALFGSTDALEVAVRDGSAQRVLGLAVGAPVTLEPA